MKKITLFLDIDGVLNNREQLRQDLEKLNFPWHESIPKTSSNAGFYPPSLGYVNEYIERFNADIVISSSWKNYFELEKLKKKLHDNGLVGNIVGCTSSSSLNRAAEIFEYGNRNQIGAFMIFEDAEKSIKNFPEKNWVFVEDGWINSGFEFKHLNEAIEKTEKLIL